MEEQHDRASSDPSVTSPPPATCQNSGRPTITPRTADEQQKIFDAAVLTARRNAESSPAKTLVAAAKVALAEARPRPGMTDEQIRQHEQRQAEQERVERVAECRRRFPVPAKYHGLKLGDLARLPADAHAGYSRASRSLAMLLSRPALVAMIGPPGTGKTSMAWGLIQRFHAEGRSAKYLKAADYIDACRATWGGTGGRTQVQVQAEHVRLGLLVLDELQVRNDTANENVLLMRLIDLRYDEGRPTLLITNDSTKDELYARFDARVVSRMRDGGGAITTDWQDMRGRIGGSQ